MLNKKDNGMAPLMQGQPTENGTAPVSRVVNPVAETSAAGGNLGTAMAGSIQVNPDPLGEDIRENLDCLARQGEEREANIDRIVLGVKADGVKDLSAEIGALIKLQKGTWKRSVVELVCDELVRAAGGDLAVFNYEPRAKAAQEVYLYTGTHWRVLDQQVFFDFANECARRAGVPMEEQHDPAFMERIYWQVAFRVAHSRPVHLSASVSYINVRNGTLEIRADGTVTLHAHRREDYFLYCLSYAYDPAAECPRWLRFLDEVLPDAEAQRVLAEYIGYCFVRGVNPEKMLVLLGGGSNGKSVTLTVVEALLGRQNVSNVTLSDLTSDAEKRCMMEGKLANISHESDREIDASMLKKIVSLEPVDIRKLYVGTRTIRDYAKLITSFNSLPRAEATHGFYRRWLILPFRHTVGEQEADVNLSAKLCGELSGILCWVLEALPGFMRRGQFSPCAVCRRELERYRMQSDSVLLFVQECCERDEGFTTPGKELFDKYKAFCYGDMIRPVSKQRFFERLESLGVARETYQNHVVFRLKPQVS